MIKEDTIIKVVSIFHFLSSSIFLISFIWVSIMVELWDPVNLSILLSEGITLASLIVIAGIMSLVYSILLLVTAIGLWRYKNWARIMATVLSVPLLLSFPIGTIIVAAEIYFLWSNKGVKKIFSKHKLK